MNVNDNWDIDCGLNTARTILTESSGSSQIRGETTLYMTIGKDKISWFEGWDNVVFSYLEKDPYYLSSV